MREVCSDENASVDAMDIKRAQRHTGSQSLSHFTGLVTVRSEGFTNDKENHNPRFLLNDRQISTGN